MDSRIEKAHAAVRSVLSHGSAVAYNLRPDQPQLVVYAWTFADSQAVIELMERDFPDVAMRLVQVWRGEGLDTPQDQLSYRGKERS